MEIIQILPAPPGIQAVYADPNEPAGLICTSVMCLALLADGEGEDEEMWIEAVDYDLSGGFTPVSLADNFLGLALPTVKADEFAKIFGKMEMEYRAEQQRLQSEKTAAGGN